MASIRELGEPSAEARALKGLGGLSEAASRFDEAVAWYQQTLELFREAGDRASEGTVLGTLHHPRHARRRGATPAAGRNPTHPRVGRSQATSCGASITTTPYRGLHPSEMRT